MTWKELTDIICPIRFCKCWIPWWFYDLECNFRPWIVTHIIYEPEFWNCYDASMTRKELMNIICPIKFCKCWIPRWFYDLECNSRPWIITHIWYMSLSFEIIMMPLWLQRNWRILFVPLNCKCWDASVILWSLVLF